MTESSMLDLKVKQIFNKSGCNLAMHTICNLLLSWPPESLYSTLRQLDEFLYHYLNDTKIE